MGSATDSGGSGETLDASQGSGVGGSDNITGTLTDRSGAGISGATITFTHSDGTTGTGKTDASGHYDIDTSRWGNWDTVKGETFEFEVSHGGSGWKDVLVVS